MKRVIITICLLLGGFVGLAQATLPPKVGDIIRRQAILCDTIDQARSIVQAAQDLGWEKGGQVMFDDLRSTPNEFKEPICAAFSYTGKVTVVESMGLMPFEEGKQLEVWLVSIENARGKGTLLWSNVPGETEPSAPLNPSALPPGALPDGPAREANAS